MEKDYVIKLSDVEGEVAGHEIRLNYVEKRVDDLDDIGRRAHDNISELSSTCRLLTKSTDSLEKAVDDLVKVTNTLQNVQTTTNTKMNIVIAILSTIGVAIIGAIIKLVVG